MRAQAAIEFLTTYGWAVVIMLSVMTVMFYLGFFSPTTVAPKSCVFPAGLSCSGYRISDGGNLTLVLVQNTGYTINITGIACGESDNAAAEPIAGGVRVYNGEMVTLTATCTTGIDGSSTPPGEGKYFKGNIFIWYTNEGTNLDHKSAGEISYRVEAGESG